MKNQVFRDPANKHEDEWRVAFNGQILRTSWQSKGAAQAHLNRLLCESSTTTTPR